MMNTITNGCSVISLKFVNFKAYPLCQPLCSGFLCDTLQL